MSEKPFTELLIRSGLIDKHIAEFEKWRLINPDDGLKETRSSGKLIADLVKDIGDLLDKEPIMRQTVLSVHSKTPPRIWCVQSIDERGMDSEFHAVKDEMGRLVADGKTKICRGDTIWCEDSVHDNFTVLEIESLYEGDKVVAKLITIEKD